MYSVSFFHHISSHLPHLVQSSFSEFRNGFYRPKHWRSSLGSGGEKEPLWCCVNGSCLAGCYGGHQAWRTLEHSGWMSVGRSGWQEFFFSGLAHPLSAPLEDLGSSVGCWWWCRGWISVVGPPPAPIDCWRRSPASLWFYWHSPQFYWHSGVPPLLFYIILLKGFDTSLVRVWLRTSMTSLSSALSKIIADDPHESQNLLTSGAL